MDKFSKKMDKTSNYFLQLLIREPTGYKNFNPYKNIF